jgi:hypothetical protein
LDTTGAHGAPLFLEPAGLADGLAPKEQRYGQEGPIRPRERAGVLPDWFPRSA